MHSLGSISANSFREEDISVFSRYGPVLAAILDFQMTTTAGHSFYIGPIGFFYNQVNDTGSSEPLVICFLDSIYISTNIENYKNRCINKSPIGTIISEIEQEIRT
jgi:hypothetical protein